MNPNEKLAQEWLQKAQSDLLYAKAGEKETKQHHITCFLCHQAAEKCLKGLLALQNIAPLKTHNLGLLMGKALAGHRELSELQREIRKLDKFYISARYPGDTFTEFTHEDAAHALDTVSKLLAAAKEALLVEKIT